jgi:2-polyprenyl-3-methyl-5-hydroxy-6-metoxy-1,4-benzoquinol methylase
MNNKVEYTLRGNCELRGLDFQKCKLRCEKILKIKDHESNLGEFDVMFCSNCNLGFTNPYPTEETTGILYESKLSGDFDIIKDSFIDRIKDHLSVKLLKRITYGRSVKNVLDYATGNGRFAYSALTAFKDSNVVAVDYQSTPPPILLKNKLNIRIQYTEISDKAYKNKKYDLIILRHVLEHAHHPVELVKFLSSLLTPNGILYIEVPNLKSGCAKIFGKYWKGYYVPRHIFHFTKQSLNEVIQLAGMSGLVEGIEMPLMGNTFSTITGIDKKNMVVQLFGVLMHPFQILIELVFGSSTALFARIGNKI